MKKTVYLIAIHKGSKICDKNFVNNLRKVLLTCNIESYYGSHTSERI